MIKLKPKTLNTKKGVLENAHTLLKNLNPSAKGSLEYEDGSFKFSYIDPNSQQVIVTSYKTLNEVKAKLQSVEKLYDKKTDFNRKAIAWEGVIKSLDNSGDLTINPNFSEKDGFQVLVTYKNLENGTIIESKINLNDKTHDQFILQINGMKDQIIKENNSIINQIKELGGNSDLSKPPHAKIEFDSKGKVFVMTVLPPGGQDVVVQQYAVLNELKNGLDRHKHQYEVAEKRELIAQKYDQVKSEVRILKENGETTRCHQMLTSLLHEAIKMGELNDPGINKQIATIVRDIGQLSVVNSSVTDLLESEVTRGQATDGVSFSELDTSGVKGATLNIRRRQVDREKKVIVTLDLTHHMRGQFENVINAIKSNDGFRATLEESLPSDLRGKISIDTVKSKYLGPDKSNRLAYTLEGGAGYELEHDAYEIKIEGVGLVRVGADPEDRVCFKKIEIEIDDIDGTKKYEKLEVLSNVLGLGPVFHQQPKEDKERMKLFTLCHQFSPSVAYDIERDPMSFNLTPNQVEDLIVSKDPEMEPIIKKYVKTNPDLMKFEEVSPGKKVWTIQDMGSLVRQQGVWGLMMSSSKNNIASKLTAGLISTRTRFEMGVIIPGDSTGLDHETGGADYVFTRAIKKGMEMDPVKYPLSRPRGLQFIIDADVMNQGGYAYPQDKYGTKEESVYKQRDNYVEFAQKLGTDTSLGNEVMIKGIISPKFIKGVLVSTEDEKKEMEKELRKNNLLDDANNVIISGRKIPVNDFIHVGDFNEKLWA